jgi:hypothetical protein
MINVTTINTRKGLQGQLGRPASDGLPLLFRLTPMTSDAGTSSLQGLANHSSGMGARRMRAALMFTRSQMQHLARSHIYSPAVRCFRVPLWACLGTGLKNSICARKVVWVAGIDLLAPDSQGPKKERRDKPCQRLKLGMITQFCVGKHLI